DTPCTDSAQCGLGGTCVQAVCHNSPAVGACDEDSDCPGGECGPALFDLRDRLGSGVGPIVIPRFVGHGENGVGEDSGNVCTPPSVGCTGGANCVDFRVGAGDPVPLEGLASTTDVLTFSEQEAIANRDLDGDGAGDKTDLVLTFRDRVTGQ